MHVSQELITHLFPHAVEWIKAVEVETLANGSPLTPDQLTMASKIGISDPGRVRVRYVGDIPLPNHPDLMKLAVSSGLISGNTAGMTFRYGVVIKEPFRRNLELLAHELGHVLQYERLGSVEAFLDPYIKEILFPPFYPNGPMEKEACALAKMALFEG